MINLLKKYTLPVLLLLLIVLHGLFNGNFKVDDTTILLVVLIVLLPYVPLFDRIKVGGFEAHISHDEVKRVAEKANNIISNEEPSELKKSDDLQSIAEVDPTLALAKARIEIEKKIRSLSDIYLQNQPNHHSLRRMVSELGKRGVIDQSLESLLHDVIVIANNAIHGATIGQVDATRLVDYAVKALEGLDSVVIDHALKSQDKKVISSKNVESYSEAEYLLKTITPKVKKPEITTYRVNQRELDAFLEGYDEYAEFIVGLERIGD